MHGRPQNQLALEILLALIPGKLFNCFESRYPLAGSLSQAWPEPAQSPAEAGLSRP
jgi:hypothetical protein